MDQGETKHGMNEGFVHTVHDAAIPSAIDIKHQIHPLVDIARIRPGIGVSRCLLCLLRALSAARRMMLRAASALGYTSAEKSLYYG